MRNVIHKFLILCGVALVFLRFVPAKTGGWLSKLFLDEIIHDRFDTWSVKVISALGVPLENYQTHITQLASLAHVIALIAQALAIALVFYIITRWV
jgi:hypothetical protein